jgi:hypothetical protein
MYPTRCVENPNDMFLGLVTEAGPDDEQPQLLAGSYEVNTVTNTTPKPDSGSLESTASQELIPAAAKPM